MDKWVLANSVTTWVLADSVTTNEVKEPNSPTSLEVMMDLHDIMMDFEQSMSPNTTR